MQCWHWSWDVLEYKLFLVCLKIWTLSVKPVMFDSYRQQAWGASSVLLLAHELMYWFINLSCHLVLHFNDNARQRAHMTWIVSPFLWGSFCGKIRQVSIIQNDREGKRERKGSEIKVDGGQERKERDVEKWHEEKQIFRDKEKEKRNGCPDKCRSSDIGARRRRQSCQNF